MEKVENRYRTARAQNAVPRHLNHVVEICDRNASSFRDGAGACDGEPDAKSKLTSEQFNASPSRPRQIP
ncbi:MAG: hypothetical protein ACREDP_07155, partial [Bradyrhizobium sp.]